MFDLANFDLTTFEASAGAAAKLLRALANERRLMILCQLGDGEPGDFLTSRDSGGELCPDRRSRPGSHHGCLGGRGETSQLEAELIGASR